MTTNPTPTAADSGSGNADRTPVSYAASGVDIEAGDRAVELMRAKVASTRRPEVIGDLGGFAGLFAVDFTRYRRPLLASSTDGVGTKLVIAQRLDRHDTVGLDLVGMVVDDLVVCGAEPLFLLDYIACGRVIPERMAEIVGGIAEGCRIAGCALVGGETAEHPGVMDETEYDLAGAGVGIVDADAVLGADRIRAGDVVVAMGSSGLHSNGYSLVRKIITSARLRLETHVDEFGASLGETLLTPTRIYARDCLALLPEVDVHAFAHVTGGGLAANVERIIPEGLCAVLDRATWSPPPVFEYLARQGLVEAFEMERTFNQGVGMVAVLPAAEADRALAVLMHHKVPAWVAGKITPATEGVRARLEGQHATA